MNIGRYQVVEKLGQGGMGVVYRAFDTLLQRDVALKLISGSLEAGSEQRERFLREARAAGQLSHRNIITIHDLGEHEGQPYLAMEYLEGEDLQRRLTRKDHMSLGRKVELVTEICEALEYAHARGIVHRDIKPANVFIAANGTARILDFGLARLITSELTNSNMMMGTVNYMAPEQVRGERADYRSDIFSLGAVMYELLGGRRAFEGDSFASTMYGILHEPPEPLLKIDPSLPHELVAIVDRALAKPRDERYQSMGEMLRDLAVFRQKLIAYDSPGFGRPAFGGDARASDPPLSPPPVHASDATMWVQDTAQIPAPTLRPSSGADPAAAVAEVAPAAAAGSGATPRTAPNRTIWIAAAAVVTVLALFAIWLAIGDRVPEPQLSTAPAVPDASAVATAVRQAAQALESGDLEGAQRHAEAALALAPGSGEARRIRDRAATALEGVTRGLQEARDHYAAGRFEDASRAAGNVLSLAPGHAEARRLMQEAGSRSQGRGADDARTRMRQAKAAAGAASAAKFAAVSYNAALGAERTAQRLYNAGELAEATAKFYEASGLFRSAELAAQTEVAARAERAAAANAERERSERERAEHERAERDRAAREAAAQPLPAPPAARPLDPKALGTDQVPPPSPPARTTTPAPPAAAPAPPPEPSAENQILDLLSRYEAALEGRSLAALKRLWPGLGGSQESAIRDEFQHAKRIQVDITVPRITPAGTAATVTFLRRYELLTVDGQTLNRQSVATMTVRRTGAGWVIDQVRFEPLR